LVARNLTNDFNLASSSRFGLLSGNSVSQGNILLQPDFNTDDDSDLSEEDMPPLKTKRARK